MILGSLNANVRLRKCDILNWIDRQSHRSSPWDTGIFPSDPKPWFISSQDCVRPQNERAPLLAILVKTGDLERCTCGTSATKENAD